MPAYKEPDNYDRASRARALVHVAIGQKLIDNNGAATTARDIVTNLGHYLAAHAPNRAEAMQWAIEQIEMATRMFREEFREDNGAACIDQRDGEDHIETR